MNRLVLLLTLVLCLPLAARADDAGRRAKAIVIATTHFNDPKIVAEACESVTGTMKGLAAAAIEEQHLMQTRGW